MSTIKMLVKDSKESKEKHASIESARIIRDKARVAGIAADIYHQPKTKTDQECWTVETVIPDLSSMTGQWCHVTTTGGLHGGGKLVINGTRYQVNITVSPIKEGERTGKMPVEQNNLARMYACVVYGTDRAIHYTSRGTGRG